MTDKIVSNDVKPTGKCVNCEKPINHNNIYCVRCGQAANILSQYWWDEEEILKLSTQYKEKSEK